MPSDPSSAHIGTVESSVSRRTFLAAAGTGGAVGALLAVAGPRAFTAHAAPVRPPSSPLAPADAALTLWYPQPASEDAMIQEALPVGNGRLGALTSGGPDDDLFMLTDATLWTGGANDALQSNGQFPYDSARFGTFTLLGKVRLQIPGHALQAVSGYRRTLDLANGIVTSSYRQGGRTYRREVFSSAPDDVVVVRLTSHGGNYTGSVTLTGTHGESTTADATALQLGYAATFENGLRYAAVVAVASRTGNVRLSGGELVFTDCQDLTIVISGGTNYVPDAAVGFQDEGARPAVLARTKASAALDVPSEKLLHTHVSDYRALFDRMRLSLGASSDSQRSLDTWSRLQARADSGVPDPELEAAYLQFGRYLMICGSRSGLPLNLQGLWIDRNDPAWMGDYHTDVNVEMNYWMADRAGLSPCFDAFADYLIAQVPSWTRTTQQLFNDPRNWFRNSSGKVAGWTTAISTNVYGGLGWWWHVAGNAWLCNSLWHHYEYTQDPAYLRKIYPLLKGACEFWDARLLTTTVTDPHSGEEQEVLIDDSDWSPEQGPTDAKGITYAQELVWALFGHFQEASERLGTDTAYARHITDLRQRLYLPRVSPQTGWLEEWMTPDNLGDPQHRHLSPLVGLFPGDRIRVGSSPQDLLDGATNLLTARGMESYGWGCAWRALCWARLKDADRAYQLIGTNLRPSVHTSNGTSMNFFDMYDLGSSSTLQIDANFGTPAAMVEMLLYSRPGEIELLPAIPQAWAKSGSITGVGARGGFTVDLEWRDGQVTKARVHSVGGRRTTLRTPAGNREVRLQPGQSVTLTEFR